MARHCFRTVIRISAKKIVNLGEHDKYIRLSLGPEVTQENNVIIFLLSTNRIGRAAASLMLFILINIWLRCEILREKEKHFLFHFFIIVLVRHWICARAIFESMVGCRLMSPPILRQKATLWKYKKFKKISYGFPEILWFSWNKK